MNQIKKGLIVTGLLPEPTELLVVTRNTDSTIRLVYKSSDNCIHNVVLDESKVALLEAPPELNPLRSRRLLFRDNNLAISLYHGTSSLFYESIKEFGLGGRDIIKELRVIDLIGELVRICDAHLQTPDESIMDLDCARRISSQEITGAGFNLRHGSTYLTPARSTAVRYARSNEFGSEAVEYCMLLYRRVAKEHPDLLTNLCCDPTSLLSFVARKPEPLLIEVRSVPLAFLRSETGGSPEAQLRVLDEWLNDVDANLFETVTQQTNFELVGALSCDHYFIFRIPESDEYDATKLQPFP